MWQHLLLQNLFSIFDSSLFGDTRFGPSGANEVQSHILFLNHKGLIQRWLHLWKKSRECRYQSGAESQMKWCLMVLLKWDIPFPSSQDHQSHRWCVPECLYQTQIPKHGIQWWWVLPAGYTAKWKQSSGQWHFFLLPRCRSICIRLFAKKTNESKNHSIWLNLQAEYCLQSTDTDLSSTGHHADPDGAGGSGGVLQTWPALSCVSILGVFLGKHIHCVSGHLLLSNQDLEK